MTIICLVDRENTKYQFNYIVKKTQLDRATKLINDLIGKWYGNRHDYYSMKYGSLIDFIEYKVEKAHIYFKAPFFHNIYF